ncbi:MAG: hypothetical protein WC511_02210 [Candidatus Pacearchaeota archaeon]
MKNLAKHHTTMIQHPEEFTEVNATILQELRDAGVVPFQFPFVDEGEVPYCIQGALQFWSFTRNWYYWVASTTNGGIPYQYAKDFNSVWGSEVRVDGFAGGQNVTNPMGVSLYHIDTEKGLKAFVGLIRQIMNDHTPGSFQNWVVENTKSPMVIQNDVWESPPRLYQRFRERLIEKHR